MSYNPNVRFQRANRGLTTLNDERIERWGEPARPSEYITGHKSPLNKSGHNADSNGIAHAVDIFVGPGNLTAAQADILAAAVIAEGIRGTKDGYPKRATNIIWNRRIAGDETGWKWAPYAGPSPHTDHLHISTIDIYYGAPLPTWFVAADYDSTRPWGILTTTGQSTGVTIIKEDTLSKAEVQEIKQHINAVLLNTYSSGGVKNLPGVRPILVENQKRIGALAGKLDAQTELIKQLAKGQGITIDYTKVEAAAAAGVAQALADGVDLDATVTIKGGQL